MQSLDFTEILQKWNDLLVEVEDKISQIWSEKYPNEKVNGGQLTIQTFVKMAIVHYSGVLHLCTFSEENTFVFYLNVPLLNRSILEIFFSTIFLLEDFPKNNELILKNYLRESHEFLEFYKNNYAGKQKWDEFLVGSSESISNYENFLETAIGLTTKEKNQMKDWQRFPRVSGVVKYFERRNAPQTNLLKYLEKCHYLRLTHISHLQAFGMVSLQEIIFRPSEKAVGEFINEQRWLALTFVIALITEIELHFDFGLKDKILFFWKQFQQSSEYANEIYEMRYEELLSS